MSSNTKICIVLGTRPEIIKMAPLIRACEKKGIEYFIIHTGQHYSYEMDKVFFEELELKDPDYTIDVSGVPYKKRIGTWIRDIREILRNEKPSVVFVQGDTDSVLAGALAAAREKVPVAHHEAGLRSNDLTMPEEKNRILTDNVSDFLFAPTEEATKNLKEEGIVEEKTFLVGNTIVDAVQQNLELAKQKVDVLSKLNLSEKEYVVVTAHRMENVDKKDRLQGILEGLVNVQTTLGIPVVWPLHHRTEMRMKEFGIEQPKEITFIKPLGFLEFLQLEAGAKIIITDSGGIQEEACILKIPCVTVRDNTERPETVTGGMNVLAGTNAEKILQSTQEMLEKDISWSNPFGDGTAGEKIMDIYLKNA